MTDEDGQVMTAAPAWRRFVAFFIDWLLISIVYCVASDLRLDSGPAVALTMLSLSLYYVVCEAVFQRTLGKFVVGTMVVAANGSKPQFAQIAVRTLLRFVPWDFLTALRKGAYMWHDQYSSTLAVVFERTPTLKFTTRLVGWVYGRLYILVAREMREHGGYAVEGAVLLLGLVYLALLGANRWAWYALVAANGVLMIAGTTWGLQALAVAVLTIPPLWLLVLDSPGRWQ